MNLSRRLRRHVAGPDAERGDSLVEVLVSVTLMAIAVLTILGALFTVLNSTAANKRAAQMDTTLHRIAETVQAKTGTFAYRRCGGGPGYPTPTGASTVTYPSVSSLVPAGWTGTITNIRYWDGVASDGTTGDPNDVKSYNYSAARDYRRLRFLNGCASNRIPLSGSPVVYSGQYDFGLQEITIRVTSTAHAARGQLTDTIIVVKRNPYCPTTGQPAC